MYLFREEESSLEEGCETLLQDTRAYVTINIEISDALHSMFQWLSLRSSDFTNTPSYGVIIIRVLVLMLPSSARPSSLATSDFGNQNNSMYLYQDPFLADLSLPHHLNFRSVSSFSTLHPFLFPLLKSAPILLIHCCPLTSP